MNYGEARQIEGAIIYPDGVVEIPENYERTNFFCFKCKRQWVEKPDGGCPEHGDTVEAWPF